jgi:hypothetical protein
MKVTTKKAAIEKQMAQLEKELKSIENSVAFKKENAVKRALANLMKKHSCSQSDLIALLQADESEPSKRRKKPAATKRKPRKLKVFKNPETGETVETRGGNHKVLKAWKAQYKLSNIDDWLFETKD